VNQKHLQWIIVIVCVMLMSACSKEEPTQNQDMASGATATIRINPTSPPEATQAPKFEITESSKQSTQSTSTSDGNGGIISSQSNSGSAEEPSAQQPNPTSPAQPTVSPPPSKENQPVANPPENNSGTQETVQESNPSQPMSATTDCIEKAAFYDDITIPDDTQFRQGDNFVKTWRLRNEGTCTWQDYQFVFAYGDIMNGPLSGPIPTTPPGETVDISVDLTAPSGGGVHAGNWQLESADGRRFGVGINGSDYFWVKIVVNWIGDQNPSASSNAACQITRNNDYDQEILALINQARMDAGLNPLASQNQLAAAALTHSTDMACNDFVDHTGSDGSTWKSRIETQGYDDAYVSENIYVGNPDFGGTAQGAFDWWMNSQVHRDNILSPKVTEVGIGYAFNPSSTYGGYFTVDFAKP
jgi:uncharacterized protein YkwD